MRVSAFFINPLKPLQTLDFIGATCWIRTRDLLITNETVGLLYYLTGADFGRLLFSFINSL